ncbi:MAG: hypothetical protein JXQ71_15400 [Verrucomicrobia bacterium]|nr:hypothetical protein [Verrucomicrobiota bacterium]
MRFRLFFGLVTVFFVAMNVALWRSEFTRHGRFTSPVPADMVWRKVLTAPDHSRLVIEHRGRKLGYCTWAPNIQEGLATGRRMTDQPPPEGMIRQLTSYTLDLDGTVTLHPDLRLRFNLHLKFDTNQAVTELAASVRVRPDTWELHANGSAQTLSRHRDTPEGRTSRAYRLSEPGFLEEVLGDLDLTVPPGMLDALGIDLARPRIAAGLGGLQWTARNDWLQLGHARFRGYRLDLDPPGRVKAALFVSPIGEILRMELPGSTVLANDALMGLE